MTADNLPVPSARPANFSEAVALVRETWLNLASAAGISVDTLTDVMVNGRNDLARVNAATAVLDRVGLPARVDVAVRLAAPVENQDDSGPQNDGAIAALRDRLTQIAARPAAEPAPPAPDDDNIVDGEIISE